MPRAIDVRPSVSIWDGDMKFHSQRFDLAVAAVVPESRSIIFPLDDEVAEWLIADSHRTANVAIDEHDGKGRWTGRLDRWQIDRVGTCKHCDHCMQKQLTAVWVAWPHAA